MQLRFVLTTLLVGVWGCFPAWGQSAQEARDAFQSGDFETAIKLAQMEQEALGQFGIDESLPVLIIQCQMAQGRYPEALKTLEAGLERYAYSIQLRWIGIQVYRYNNQIEKSLEAVKEIEELVSRSSWRFRDADNQLVLARFLLEQGADAKEVLTKLLRPLQERFPTNVDIFRTMGDLALDRGDYGLAAEQYRQIVRMQPGDVQAHFGLVRCFRPSDAEAANQELDKVLAINPKHVGAHLLAADQQLAGEDHEAAEAELAKVLAVNPKHPVAWAFRAVIAHLENRPRDEAQARVKALADWPGNPEVDHIIGRELSAKYRFAEGQAYQRRALVLDDAYRPAKIQLAHDLLRLGQEVEGWQLADEVFDEDQYSVLAHNLVMLRDRMAGFTTLQRGPFVVRMETVEGEVYGQRVLDLLERAAETLTKKYAMELETPIIVEIFPQQQDFAIRTFGLPGGSGFLGVCFGRVITMNSPQAQGASLTSWESVLWHEFCHVVTLQKTRNRMPRWLSEGISVYEERLADPAWGENLNRRYREMLLKELTPVSQLSGAFLRPPSPLHLQFAYFESSLVVEFLHQQYGPDTLLAVLDELAEGTPIADALRRHAEPSNVIDKRFAEFARQRAEEYAPDVDWAQPDEEAVGQGVAYWEGWLKEHPNSLFGLNTLAALRLQAGEAAQALPSLKSATELCPTDTTAWQLLAQCHRELDQIEEERQALERLAKLDSDDVNLYVRLLELTSAAKQWDAVERYARRLIAVNPMIQAPYLALAEASEALQQDEQTASALRSLLPLEPVDPVGARYRLASALFRLQQWEPAKRQVLFALEEAPRYREAHALLLKILEQQERP